MTWKHALAFALGFGAAIATKQLAPSTAAAIGL
jgi:hypothetical protein